MTRKERETAYLSGEGMECCGGCVHYYQHYVESGWDFTPVYDGHCVYPRLKSRLPSEVCQHFQRREKNEE